MSIYTKVSGTWQKIEPFVKSAGQWRLARSVWAKISGTWEQVYTTNLLDPSFHDEFTADIGDKNIGGYIYGVNSNDKVLVYSDAGLPLGGKGFSLIDADGEEDYDFLINQGTGIPYSAATAYVYAATVMPDDSIIFAGSNLGSFNGNTVSSTNPVVKLNSDGTFNSTLSDCTWRFGQGNTISPITDKNIVGMPDGKFIISTSSNSNLIIGYDPYDYPLYQSYYYSNVRIYSADGSSFTAINPTSGTTYTYNINTCDVQSDGKIIFGGYFLTWNGTAVNHLVRLNSDYSLDTTFVSNLGTGFNDAVHSVKVQSDGKILVGGNFTTFNGTTVNRLVRLNSDGTIDTSFTSPQPNNFVWRIHIFDDNKILISGAFTSLTYPTTVPRGKIARLNSDGSEDTEFGSNQTTTTNFNATMAVKPLSNGQVATYTPDSFYNTYNGVYGTKFLYLNADGTRKHSIYGIQSSAFTVKAQPDGKILVGSSGTVYVGGSSGPRLYRYNSDGSLDTTFMSNLGTGFSSSVFYVEVQSDGKILVGGYFTTFNGSTRNRLVRLNSDGTEDTSFYTNLGTGFNSDVQYVKVQSDGKILVGGYFTTFNGSNRNRLVRLNSDGTEDTSFYTNLGTGFTGTIYNIQIDSNNYIYVGGIFTTFNGSTRNRLVRLNSDGTEDTSFYTNLGTGFNSYVYSIDVSQLGVSQSGGVTGGVLVAGSFTSVNGNTSYRYLVKLTSTGAIDTAFNNNVGTNANNAVFDICYYDTDKISLVGNFLSFNGTICNGAYGLNADGTVDTRFQNLKIHSNLITTTYPRVIKNLSNGKFLIGYNKETYVNRRHTSCVSVTYPYSYWPS